MALRYDTVELGRSETLANGHVRLDAALTRAGIFLYRNADGTTRREYRPPAEVFKADSLATFGLVPVTNDHPPVLLDATNTKEYQVGTVSDSIRQDGELVRASMVVTDAKTIADMKRGKVQVSCGYTADTDYTPGEVNGQKYDAVQSNIRGNHVAIVTRGKAGADARVRLDADEAEMVDTARNDTEENVKITINGVEYDVPDQVGQAIAVERRDAQAKLDAATVEIKATTAKLDATTAKLDAATEAKTLADKAKLDAVDPVKFNARVNQRVALVAIARDVLAPEQTDGVKLDALDDAAVRAAVLAKLAPDVKLDGRSPEYIQARFDIAVETRAASNPALTAVRVAVDGAKPGDTKLDASEEGARTRMRAANREAGRTALPAV